METEVLIVGAGPVGLALALELASQGRRCVVVEKTIASATPLGPKPPIFVRAN